MIYKTLIKEEIVEGEVKKVYGIKCYDKFYSISSDKEFVQNIVDKFNRFKVPYEIFLECLYDEIIDEGFLRYKYLL